MFLPDYRSTTSQFTLALPNILPGVPSYLPDPTQPGGWRRNSAEFIGAPHGKQGNLPRNDFRGSPIEQIDFAASKRFVLSERFSLVFRAEYFNLFNHSIVGSPAANANNYLFRQRLARLPRPRTTPWEGSALSIRFGGGCGPA